VDFLSYLATLDWGMIGGTFVATIAGAVVGVAGVSRSEKRQALAGYEARLTEALAQVVGAFPARLEELEKYGDRWDRYNEWIDAGGDPDVEPPIEPGPYEIATRLEAARMVARKDDQMTMQALAEAFYALSGMKPYVSRARLTHLPEMVRKWRSGEWDSKRARSEFDAFARTARERIGLTPPPPWSVNGGELED
jgi:hypothetical protein